MRWIVSFILALIGLTGPYAASAQEVLDRVEPTRLEDRKVESLRTAPVTTPEVESQQTAQGATGENLFVGAIEITGLKQLRNSNFSDIVQSFIGQTLSSTEVSDLADRLADRARKRFPLASASVIPQSLEGAILRVEIDEGQVDEIEVKGFQNRRIQAILRGLITGAPVTVRQLERALMLARDVDGISIRETTIRRDAGRNVLVVQGFYDRFRGQFSFDNDSTKPIGPFESFAFVQANGLFSHDDSLQAYLLSALPEPSELGFARVRYAKRADDGGTEVSVSGSFSRSKPGSYLEQFDLTGESWMASAGVSRPLERTVRSSLWVDASFSLRQLRQERADTLSRRDRLAVARVGWAGITKLAGGSLQSRITVSHGLDILSATEAGDPMRSRSDADGTFTSLAMLAQWSAPITGRASTTISVSSQLADKPLLVSEEIGLGGARYGRGYDYSERSGDEGVMGYLEVSYDLKKVGPINGVEPYAFVDGGKVSNLSSGTGGGTLASAGGGIRFDVDRKTDASFEVAAPLTGDRYETSSKAPRIRFSVTRYF
ncbi:ShlB/FhaC/HecB family hemolysin secretion/activation protein [Qipengyuania sp.]|uniref:ShlB/FhaC/HecB family hemolysin secretion/activation protein n=1 Tax=Qipengyuania sp. TaxID=2004515 RepID=UPI0035C7DC55